VLEIEKSGGEAGIRTLGTGVSPYNGLANSTRPLPIAQNQSVTVSSSALSRAETGCLADANAPQYAPLHADAPFLTQKAPDQLVPAVAHATRSGLGIELCSAVTGARSAVSSWSFNPTAMSRAEGRPVLRVPQELRLHRALDELGWVDEDEFNSAARQTSQALTEPILITTDSTILAGLGRWRLALFERRNEIPCIEYALNEDESLVFMLTHHQIRRGWNDFVRIRLAITLASSLQQKAVDNMRSGGKFKGLAILPKAQHINVRREIARIAGVGDRNVSNVETILETAHPRVIDALQNGTLTINRATQFCKLPRVEQVEQFVHYSEERATNKVIRQAIRGPAKIETSIDVIPVLDALQRQHAQQPGSVAVRVGRHKSTVIMVGKDLIAAISSQTELRLT
jgi:hypothetical protein